MGKAERARGGERGREGAKKGGGKWRGVWRVAKGRRMESGEGGWDLGVGGGGGRGGGWEEEAVGMEGGGEQVCIEEGDWRWRRRRMGG